MSINERNRMYLLNLIQRKNQVKSIKKEKDAIFTKRLSLISLSTPPKGRTKDKNSLRSYKSEVVCHARKARFIKARKVIS
jgi:hypothetical protein